MEPLILLTNDDGIYAPGLHALCQGLRNLGEVWIVAPDTERSAVGHAITLTQPIRVDHIQYSCEEIPAYSCTGTPADCVKLAVKKILPRPPDLIVSGINPGANTGLYILYSGTVSAATEGMILGVPSIAISLDTWKSPDFFFAQQFAGKIVKSVLEHKIPDGTILNINIPAIPENDIKGVQVTRHGKAVYEEDFDQRLDPRGRTYYWMKGVKAECTEANDRDNEALKNGYVSVTPIQFNLTDESATTMLHSWDIFDA